MKEKIKKNRPYLRRHSPKGFYVFLFHLPSKGCIVIFTLEIKPKFLRGKEM